MIHSMTGFARTEQQADWGRLVWELRAVNHRYLDVQFRLPEEFRGLEPKLRRAAQQAVSRGKFEARLKFESNPGAATPPSIDEVRLCGLAEAIAHVSETTVVTPPDALAVLAWPGVLQETAPQLKPAVDAAETLFETALAEFNQSREREGARLLEFLTSRIESMQALLPPLRERAPQMNQLWLERLRKRCADLGVDVDPSRLAQEAVIAGQRLDVEEELSRLEAHLAEVREVLQRDEAVGRRLDFLMQELNREANTLSSKSQDEAMTNYAVDMKVLIEQLREQVQNVA